MILGGTLGLYLPLMQTFFPECEDRFGSRPLSGFRALRTGMDLGALPSGFGIEAHLNCQIAIAGASSAIADVGWYRGRYKRKDSMASEIAFGVLDQAQRSGRLEAQQRPAWNEWVADVADRLGRYTGDPADLFAARRRVHASLLAPGRRWPIGAIPCRSLLARTPPRRHAACTLLSRMGSGAHANVDRVVRPTASTMTATASLMISGPGIGWPGTTLPETRTVTARMSAALSPLQRTALEWWVSLLTARCSRREWRGLYR